LTPTVANILDDTNFGSTKLSNIILILYIATTSCSFCITCYLCVPN